MRGQLLAAWFFALSLSAWLGRAELHTDDTGILAGLIATGACLLAMVEPRHPWLWGAVVPSGVIGVNIWHYAYGTRSPNTGGIGGLVAIAAFTITLGTAGAYLGSFVRRRVAPAR